MIAQIPSRRLRPEAADTGIRASSGDTFPFLAPIADSSRSSQVESPTSVYSAITIERLRKAEKMPKSLGPSSRATSTANAVVTASIATWEPASGIPSRAQAAIQRGIRFLRTGMPSRPDPNPSFSATIRSQYVFSKTVFAVAVGERAKRIGVPVFRVSLAYKAEDRSS